MIKKKVLKVKTKAKVKVKSKVKAEKLAKKVSKKIKNPVYLNIKYKVRELIEKYNKLYVLSNNFANVYSNNNTIYGVLNTKPQGSLSYFILENSGEAGLNYLNSIIFTLKNYSHQMPNRDDLSLIAENDDYLGNELFWDEHDEFKKDSFKKSTDYQFTLGNVDKVDVENNRIYVRRLKQVKNKND